MGGQKSQSTPNLGKLGTGEYGNFKNAQIAKQVSHDKKT
jgi:hypothetical protein